MLFRLLYGDDNHLDRIMVPFYWYVKSEIHLTGKGSVSGDVGCLLVPCAS